MITKPTSEQQKIIETEGNVVVTARPGSGKTYTIVEKIAGILENVPEYQGVIAISYTNKASDELKRRCKNKGIDLKSSFFGTIDKFYTNQIIRPFACHLTKKYIPLEIEKGIPDGSEYELLKGSGDKIEFTSEQAALVLKMLERGFIFLPLSGAVALYITKQIPEVLVYLKARFTHIFIDEYQDCGAVQHEFFLYLVHNHIWGVAVGDPDQAIYGFNHRWPKYLLQLTGMVDFQHFELSKNHRCHESIINYSRGLFGIVPSSTEEKRVFKVDIEGDEKIIASKIECYLPKIMKKYSVSKPNQVAILCKLNHTIDLMDKYLVMPHKLFKSDPLESMNSEMGNFFRYILRERFSGTMFPADLAEQFFSKEFDFENYHRFLRIVEIIYQIPVEHLDECSKLFIDLAELLHLKSNKRAIDALQNILSSKDTLASYMPAKDDEVNVMTIHKSKGLEFSIVFILDLYKYVFSNNYEKKESENSNQALNLYYVAITRAKDAVYFLNASERSNKNGGVFRAHPSELYFLPGLEQLRKDVIW